MLDAVAKAAPLLAQGEDDKYQAEVMGLAPAAKAEPCKAATTRGDDA